MPPPAGGKAGAAADTAAFAFPDYYQFPPFFTLQPVEETRGKQLQMWQDLLCSYLQHHHANSKKSVSVLNVNSDAKLDLFHNAGIRRGLTPDAIRAVLQHFCDQGFGRWLDARERTQCCCSWQTSSSWAAELFKYADDTGQLNAMMTVYELVEGDETRRYGFHGLAPGTCLAALQWLQQERKATLKMADDPAECGVKFHYP
jgi:ESCRT-II complex subunit VPS25